MNDYIMGTCSLCGGPVVGPAIWHGICPPPIHCQDCGAEPAVNGKIIEMVPRKYYDYSSVTVSTTGIHPDRLKR